MSKKTESIEVRLSPELKERLTNLGAERGEAMSAIVRSLVEREVDQETSSSAPFSNSKKGHPTMPKIFRTPRKAFTSSAVALSALIALGLGLNIMTINVATAHEDLAALFKDADLDKDGSVDEAEFAQFFEMGEITDEDIDLANMNADFDLPAVCKNDEAALIALEDDIDMDQEVATFFAEIDGNKDGKVGLEEMLASLKANALEEFTTLDSNKDGAITLSEFLVVAETDLSTPEVTQSISAPCLKATIAMDEVLLTEEFGEIDINGDFMLTLDEFQNPV